MNRCRVLDLTTGVTLVVSDLYGDWDAFTRYVGRFRQLHSRRRADRLLFLGDLIHPDPRLHRYADTSLDILLAIGQLQADLGVETVIVLMGDHEIAQHYRIAVSGVNLSAMTHLSQEITTLDAIRHEIVTRVFERMPLFVRTASGVMFTHAGASRSAVLNWSEVDSADDPWLLAEIAGTSAEQTESVSLYARLVEHMLTVCSEQAPVSQRFLVSGHVPIAGGCAMTTPRQLRIASAACASPREAGSYLLLDVAQPIHSLEGLTEHLGSIFTMSSP